jgi:Predicted transcriptional regulator
MRSFVSILVFCLSSVAFATLPVGKIPPSLTLQGDTGGKVKEGKPWSSSELKDRVHVMFYVAPSESELNQEAADELKKESFVGDLFGSVAVIDMSASWIPNWIIASKLESKQKEFPRTTYVKDLQGTLVKKWNLKDNSSDIVVFDPEGRVVYSHDGKLSKEEVKKMIQVVKEQVTSLKNSKSKMSLSALSTR